MSKPKKFVRLGEQTAFLWGYEWLRIENFIIADPAGLRSDIELLQMFIADRVYEYSYQTSRVTEQPAGIHGPFWVSEISPSSFHQLTQKEFSSRVAATLQAMRGEYFSGSEHDWPQREAWRQLDLVMGPGDSYFELTLDPANPKVHHESWNIVSPFHEFIVTNQSENRVSICVLAGD